MGPSLGAGDDANAGSFEVKARMPATAQQRAAPAPSTLRREVSPVVGQITPNEYHHGALAAQAFQG